MMLYEESGMLCLTDGEEHITLTSSGYEPCLYLTTDKGRRTTIHNAYETDWIAGAARNGTRLRSISGREYDAAYLCRLLLLAGRKWTDVQMSDVEESVLYPIPLKGENLRERIEEMMAYAGDAPSRCDDIRTLHKAYASAGVPIHSEGERFLLRYAHLFSQLSPGFWDDDDNVDFYSESFDELPSEELSSAARLSARAEQASGCPVTPVGMYGFRRPFYLFVGQNGLLYGLREGSDGALIYHSLIDLYCDVLKDHWPVGMDD